MNQPGDHDDDLVEFDVRDDGEVDLRSTPESRRGLPPLHRGDVPVPRPTVHRLTTQARTDAGTTTLAFAHLTEGRFCRLLTLRPASDVADVPVLIEDRLVKPNESVDVLALRELTVANVDVSSLLERELSDEAIHAAVANYGLAQE